MRKRISVIDYVFEPWPQFIETALHLQREGFPGGLAFGISPTELWWTSKRFLLTHIHARLSIDPNTFITNAWIQTRREALAAA
jgi:hypothetical protein